MGSEQPLVEDGYGLLVLALLRHPLPHPAQTLEELLGLRRGGHQVAQPPEKVTSVAVIRLRAFLAPRPRASGANFVSLPPPPSSLLRHLPVIFHFSIATIIIVMVVIVVVTTNSLTAVLHSAHRQF